MHIASTASDIKPSALDCSYPRMTLRTRSANCLAASMLTNDHVLETPKPPQPLPSSLSQRAISQILTSTANLANTLPTGTLLVFQLLMPIFTNHGKCDYATRLMTFLLLMFLAMSCFFAHFTDSFRSTDGQVYYGFATYTGMRLFDPQAAEASSPDMPDLSKYKLGCIDWIHAILSVFVFGAFAMQDKNILGCFFPMPPHEVQEFLELIPIAIGLVSSLLFVIFPTRRHGIGYPVTSGN